MGIALKKYSIFFFLSLLLLIKLNAQSNIVSSSVQNLISGQLINIKTKAPLPYANVLLQQQNKGGITNEQGYFSINTDVVDVNDTLVFLYIGYQTKKIAFVDFKLNSIVSLKEETFNLNETFVFANEFNVKEIIKKVAKNIEANYKPISLKKQLFIREKNISYINNIDIKFKKSSFESLNKKMTELVEKKIPKESISYTDFLGDFYFSEKINDTLKIKPIKIVSLKDKNLADVNQLENMFEKMFSNTKEDEYWKIKTGIIGSKIDFGDEVGPDNLDSLKSYYKNRMQLTYYRRRLDGRFKSLLKNKKQWDFLYHTGNYNYNLVSGANINGEDLYIIDFTPKKGGDFEGRVYIAMDTYALIKADYSYAKGKIGTNIHLMGVGYTENVFDISVYFEKIGESYQLKYLAHKRGNKMSFDRNVSLIKKKKRFLIDKKMNEIKVRLNVKSNEQSSIEILVLDSKNINHKIFENLKQKKVFKLIYVDKFSDSLWKDYSIIEPTKQMREYKKNNN